MTNATISIPPRPAANARFDAAQQRLQTIVKSANSLIVQGYTILFLESDARCAKPVIHVMSEPRLWDMAAQDKALYYRTGTDMLGPYRIGQFERDGAIVKWVERGH